MKYYAEIKQLGEGCDYTIACAVDLIELKGSSMSEATDYFMSLLDGTAEGEKMYSGFQKLESAKIMEVRNEWIFDLAAAYKKIESDERREMDIEKENQERKLFEKLKKKYQ